MSLSLWTAQNCYWWVYSLWSIAFTNIISALHKFQLNVGLHIWKVNEISWRRTQKLGVGEAKVWLIDIVNVALAPNTDHQARVKVFQSSSMPGMGNNRLE